MKTRKSIQGHAGRLHTGTVVLSAAKSVDTSCVANRLAAFTEAQAAYAAAQRVVDDIQTRINTELAKLADEDAALEIALDKLVLALLMDRQPRLSPFAAFGAPSPSALMRVAYDEKPKGLRKLIGAIHRDETLSQASHDAATAVEAAVQVLEEALAPILTLQEELVAARSDRDAFGERWDEALASLKRGAQAGVDEGAPGLYAALFERAFRRGHRRRPKADADTVANETSTTSETDAVATPASPSKAA